MGRANSPPAGLTHERPFPPDCSARYACIKPLAEGGFGAVWLAEDRTLERRVAIKLLLSEVVDDPEQVRRFDAEARITAALEHPHIVRVLDHGAAHGVPWIAYELIGGGSLRAALHAGRIDLAMALNAAMQVASALDAAHAKGVVHRDIKPENVLEAEPGRYKVTDFGIARFSGDGGVKTKTGVIMGTPNYIAPELVAGEVPGPASDLYALAVMLFELVTGRPPFDGPNPIAVLDAHLRAPPPRARALAPGVSPALEAFLARALAKDPRERPASGAAFAAELERIASADGGDGTAGGPAPRSTGAARTLASVPASRRSRAQPTAAVSLAATRAQPVQRPARPAWVLALCGLAVLVAAFALGRNPARGPAPQPPVVAASALPSPAFPSPAVGPTAAAPVAFARVLQPALDQLNAESNALSLHVGTRITALKDLDPEHGAAGQAARLLHDLRRALELCRTYGEDPLRLAGLADQVLTNMDQLFKKLGAKILGAELRRAGVYRELDELDRMIGRDWHPNGSAYRTLLRPRLESLRSRERNATMATTLEAEAKFCWVLVQRETPGGRALTPVEALALTAIAIRHDQVVSFDGGPPEMVNDLLPIAIRSLDRAVTAAAATHPGKPPPADEIYLLAIGQNAMAQATTSAADPRRDGERRRLHFRLAKHLSLSIGQPFWQHASGKIPADMIANLATVPGLSEEDRQFLDGLRRELARHP